MDKYGDFALKRTVEKIFKKNPNLEIELDDAVFRGLKTDEEITLNDIKEIANDLGISLDESMVKAVYNYYTR